MFLIILKYKSKNDRVNFPVDFGINPINPSDYDYTIENAGNIQDGKGCSATIDSIQPIDFVGNIKNTIQNYVLLTPPKSDGSEISPKKTIRFDGLFGPYQKPFKKYHIKTAYQSDMLIIPFSFYISLAPTNRIYFTSILTKKLVMVNWMIVGQLRVARENKPLTKTIKLILSSDHIQMMASGHTDNNHSLIYGIHIYKQNIKNKHREAMAINDYSSMIGINKIHKNYACFLKCKYVYVQNIVCVYVKNMSLDLIRTIVQRGSGVLPGRIYKYNIFSAYTYICTKS